MPKNHSGFLGGLPLNCFESPQKVYMTGLLVHVCCAPCAVYPLLTLFSQEPNQKITPWFYNPNIHPKEEFIRRRDGVAFLAQVLPDLVEGLGSLKVDFSAPYEPSEFLSYVSSHPQEPERCRLCYRLRLLAAAREAVKKGLGAFTTTLLYSRRQKHEIIAQEAQKAAQELGIEFYYQDFRNGWQQGIELSRRLGLYRQRWCGCVYGAN
jgi:predicted adenine nucleotide alpha hydrolase (AANH) superfamily ATPase